jgi:hypothetical protein
MGLYDILPQDYPSQPFGINHHRGTLFTYSNQSDFLFVTPFLSLAEKPISTSMLSIRDIHPGGFAINDFPRMLKKRAFVRKLQAIPRMMRRVSVPKT